MLSINKQALIHNVDIIRHLAPHSKLLCMVKANAYGHGLIPIAKCLELLDVDGLGAACLQEAIQLREAGINTKIVIMRGVYNKNELSIAKKLNLDLVVHHESQIELLLSENHQFNLWIKINTGMNRLGLNETQIESAIEKLYKANHRLVLMTHFANSETARDAVTLEQIKKFDQMTHQYSVEKSLCNSGGILNYPDCHRDWIRPGLMLYGVSPIKDTTSLDYKLKPVMTLESSIISIYTAKKDEGVGYHGLYCCEENMPIGIVGAGYGDGYSSLMKSGTPVLVNGIEAPLIGRVSMDMLAIDLRNISKVKLQDRVILWGDGLPVEKIAQHNSLLAYELLCHARER